MNTARCGVDIDEMTAIKLDDPGVAFSLECVTCDDGMNVDSFEQAILYGWINISFEDGFGFNFLGYCPECKERD